MLIRDLNQIILSLAPAYEARDVAPATYAELVTAPRLIVWSGASEGTIYRDARVNHAFRAWHDAAHIAGGFAFDLDGERAACEYQIAQMRRALPLVPDLFARVIRAEVIGQAEYFATHGAFPSNQAAFIAAYLRAQ